MIFELRITIHRLSDYPFTNPKILTFAHLKNKKTMKLTVIGAGNMGGALIHGWAKSGKVESITIADKNEQLLANFKAKYPQLTTTTDNVAAAKGADIIILVVKPWLMPTVVGEIKPVLDLKRQIVVSDAANFTTDKLAETLGADGNLLYVIPNIAAEFGASMSFIAKGKSTTDAALAQVKGLYDIVGDTLVVAENLVGPGMMMASCGIAYVMRYIRAQMEGGCEMGFYPAQAKQIALQTMQGAVSLLKETGWHPEEAIDKVTTPGGVTIKGLNELDHAGFNSAVIRSLKAGLK
jgi:pyrroline-5-carboxylate reductase